MPRSKKAASRGKKRGAHGGNRRRTPGLASSSFPFAGTRFRQGNESFSLQSEALNTQLHQSSCQPDQKLRHTKVVFVSAGELKRSEVTAERGLAHMTLNETSEELQCDGYGTRIDMNLNQDASLKGHDDRPSKTVDGAESSFIIDNLGSEPVLPGLSPPNIRSTSPTPSSSSDDVILFAGRDKTGKGLSKPSDSDSYDTRIRTIEDKIHENQALLAMNADQAEEPSVAQYPAFDSHLRLRKDQSRGSVSQDFQQRATLTSEEEAARNSYYRPARSHHNRRIKRRQEQASIDDYISNMEAQEIDVELSFNQRDLGGKDSDPWQETETSSVDPSKISLLNEWGHLGLEDFDIMSTSEEILGPVKAILSKRDRKNGRQYLVVWENCSVDEAHWVPSASLADINSLKLIAEFEREGKEANQVYDEDDTDSDTDDDHTCAEEDDASDDDTDLLQRKIDCMTDEKIAKLLAKQEELGMGSPELILFDDSSEADPDEAYTVNIHGHNSVQRAIRKVHNINRAKSDIPAASSLADAYDGFDVMDFQRSSLKKKSKRRKSRLAFDLSDSDLEATMALAWSKDRARKRERKEERQDLRAQGLLSKKDTKPDPKAKYKEGMAIEVVKDEIKRFLMGNDTTLSLTPMAKANRKIIHELANVFNLKSKSVGNGNKRFPVLYRTQHTLPFSENMFSTFESRLTRRYLPRQDLRERNSALEPRRSERGAVNNGVVSYRDGDIVGGSAPELGVENKGRAMLEKMGWSTGTALGALNNKGILQPVSHVVKITKAGLG